MTPNETKLYQPVIDEITDTLTKHEVTAINGEKLMMFIAGMSMGKRLYEIDASQKDVNVRVDDLMSSLVTGFMAAVMDQIMMGILKGRDPLSPRSKDKPQ